MPYLIGFKDDRLPAGSGLFRVVSGIVANLGQDRAGHTPNIFAKAFIETP
jgi:hypothetical protein